MGRINTNVSALVALNQLGRTRNELDSTLQRLSSGLRINRGADDPAGLIVSENLRSEIAGVRQAINNSQRASNIIATSEGALNEVAALLNDVQDLIIEAANTGAVSEDEIRANQLQIDSAIDSITRIGNSTRFAGRRLLDGSLDYTLSGVDNTDLANVRVNNATFGTAAFIPVNVEVTQSAQRARLYFTASQIGQSVNIEVAGNNGVTALSFSSGTTASAIVAAVNLVADATGVSASLINGANPASGLTFQSKSFGTDAFVQVEALASSAGPFQVTDAPAGAAVIRDVGRDVVVSINGAAVRGDGLDVNLNTSGLSLTLTVREILNTLGAAGRTTFAITGGGALFQLGGGINTNEQKSLGIQSISATGLGDSNLGFLSQIKDGENFSLINGSAATAQKIVDAAIRQVSSLRGRLGAFEKNTLATNVNQLQITLENLTASESVIRDVDFAAETSRLTRSQILQQAGTAVLAIANQSPQSVLQLLQG